MKTSTVFRALLLTYVFLFINNSLQAQDLPETEAGSNVLEEVTVTATRRGDTDIMTTPVSITKLVGDEVEKYALRDLNDIAVSVPGLSAGTVSAFNTAQFAMRGVSETTIILYKESPVAVTVDEFVVPHIQTSNLEVFDIESIEVLRGPQGTLFGKNTTGGVIVVQTKRPVLEENSAQVQLQYGSFDTRKANMALNFGIGETVAFRFAGMYLKSDGYYKNTAPYGPIGETILPFNTVKHLGATGAGDGSTIGGDDVFSGRAKLLWSPNDDVNLLFQYEYVRDRSDSPPIVQESTPGYIVPLWSFVPAPLDEDPVKNAGSTMRDDGKFLDIPGGHKVDIDGYYLNGDWAINDNYTLYFNAGHRKQKSILPSSYVGQTGPISIFDATRDDNRKTSQVEVRLGSNLDGPINFVVGGYYQKDDTEFCVLQYVGFFDGFFIRPLEPDFYNDNPRILCNTQDAKAKALYIDGTWQVNDKFNVTAGFRYSNEKKAWAGRPMRFALGGEPLFDALDKVIDGADFEKYPEGVVYNDHKWNEPTYRVILGYDFTDDLFGFFGYSRGFKSGGYNDQLGTQLDPITDLAAEPTEPEIANSWEGGIKSTFADGAATIAVNAYWVKYTDAQRTFNVSFPGGGQETLFFNAAEMTVKGVEMEGAWAATESLLFNYNVSYMDAKFDKFEADTNFDGEIDTVLTGATPTRAPKWMGSVDGTYMHPAGDAGSMEYKLRYSYEGKSVSSYSDVDPLFNTFLDSRGLLDASITFYDAENRFYFRLLGANLTDKRYKTGALSVGALWIMSAYGSPRYYGIEFGGKLGW